MKQACRLKVGFAEWLKLSHCNGSLKQKPTPCVVRSQQAGPPWAAECIGVTYEVWMLPLTVDGFGLRCA